METQRDELVALAAEYGWSARKADNFEAHDWSVETWELESIWSPVGIKAYVTFPINEQNYRERKPWAIRVSAGRSGTVFGSTADFVTSLIQWKNEKHRFIEFLDQLRKK